MSNPLEGFTDAELIDELEDRGAMPQIKISDYSGAEIADEFTRRGLRPDLLDVLRFIERELWSPSEWEQLQNALAVAVKPRGAA